MDGFSNNHENEKKWTEIFQKIQFFFSRNNECHRQNYHAPSLKYWPMEIYKNELSHGFHGFLDNHCGIPLYVPIGYYRKGIYFICNANQRV